MHSRSHISELIAVAGVRGVAARLLVPLLFILVPALLLWPLLIGGKVLYYGSSLLQFYPWRKLVAEMWRSGQWPLWNPYLGLGAPLAANLQSAVYYPLNLLFLLVPTENGLGYATILHLTLAGLGVYLFCRALRLSRFASLLGGLSFMLSGFYVSRILFLGMISAAAWLPFVLYAVEMTVQAVPGVPDNESRVPNLRRWVALGALFLAMLLCAGHMQIAFYAAWAIGGYAAMRVGIIARRRWLQNVYFWHQPAVKALTWLGVMAFLGVGLSALQLLPTWELTQLSARSVETDRFFLLVYSLRPWQLLGLVAPDAFGNPGFGNFWGPGNYWETSTYVGVLPLILAIWGCFQSRLRGVRLFFLGLATVSLVLAMGHYLPFYPFVFDHVPGFSLFQAPARLIYLATLSLSVLAAFGAQAAREGLKRPTVSENYEANVRPDSNQHHRPEAFNAPLKAGIDDLGSSSRGRRRRLNGGYVLAMVGIGLAAGGVVLHVQIGEVMGVRVSLVDSLARFGVLLALAGILIGLKWTLRPPVWMIGALLLVLVDLLSFGYPLNPFTEAEAYQLPSATAKYLAGSGRMSRVLTPNESFLKRFFQEINLSGFGSSQVADVMRTRDSMLPNLAAAEHISEVYNYDPLQLEDVDSLRSAIERSGYPEGALAAINVSVVLSDTAPSPRFSDPVEIGPAKLFLVANPLPRAYLVPGSQLVSDHQEALTAFVSSAFSPTKTVILERADAEKNQARITWNLLGSDRTRYHGDTSGWQAVVERYEPLKVTVRTVATAASLLVLSDAYYPGWKVTVDGQFAPLLRANYALRAVPLTGGSHLVEFTFDPVSAKLGGGISLVCGVAILMLLIFPRRQTAGPNPT